MVNFTETFGIDPASGHPERALALGYAPAHARAGIAAIFALDATLAKLALGTREAMVAQLRLTWWYESLMALGDGVVPPQPILRGLADANADGEALATMETGWERLLSVADDGALTAFAEERGTLFREAARLAGAGDEVMVAGRGWALADLALSTADAQLAVRARTMAAPLLAQAKAQKWSSAGRFLGALVHVARADMDGTWRVGAPTRVARLAWHRLTGS